MFYVPVVLGRKGPLSVVWLAAHIDKKVSKNQILNTDIPAIIEMLLNSQLKISLRVTSDLILGICKIHHRQTKYFFDDTKRIFELAQVYFNRLDSKRRIDLPENKRQAPLSSINLPEIFDFDDLNFAELSPPVIDVKRRVSRHSITLNEIPPLTEEEKRNEEEVYRRIYDLGDNNLNQSATIEDFFDDVLPLPPVEDVSMMDTPMIPEDDVQYTTIVSPPADMTEPHTTTAPELVPSTSKGVIDLKASVEQGRLHTTDISSRNQFIPLELETLNRSSQLSQLVPRRTRRKRARSLVIDEAIKMSDYQMRRALRTVPRRMIVRDFCPMPLVPEVDPFAKPSRKLPDKLAKYFTAACCDDAFPQESVEEAREPPPRERKTLTTEIEVAGPLEPTDRGDEEFFDEQLPMPPPIDDYEDELPQVREMDQSVEQKRRRTNSEFEMADFSVPEIDRSHVEELFQSKITDLFSLNNDISFDEFIPPDCDRMTAAIFFFHLLELENNESVYVQQVESFETFNEIIITRLEQPAYTPMSMPI